MSAMGDEGICLTQTPNELLPPPPSAEVDTAHWERAMFRDRQERLERAPSRVLTDTVTSWVSMRRQNS
jgi:hypothetical protein